MEELCCSYVRKITKQNWETQAGEILLLSSANTHITNHQAGMGMSWSLHQTCHKSHKDSQNRSPVHPPFPLCELPNSREAQGCWPDATQSFLEAEISGAPVEHQRLSTSVPLGFLSLLGLFAEASPRQGLLLHFA